MNLPSYHQWVRRLAVLGVVSAFAIPFVPAARAATTGFNQTGAGPYDYNTATNWVDDTINGLWDTSLALAASQTVTFSADTTLTTGLTFDHSGNNVSLRADGNGNRTLTLGGDISVNPSGNRTITLGSGTSGRGLNLSLGANRAFTVASGDTLTIANVISDGGAGYGIVYGGGTLNLYGANTFSGGITVKSGLFSLTHGSSAGTGTITLGDTSGSANATATFAKDRTYANSFIIENGSSGTRTIALNGASPSGTTVSGDIALSSDLTITKTGDREDTMSGAISGNGNITYTGTSGSSQTILSGANTSVGSTTVTGGTLRWTKASSYNGGSVSVSGTGSTLAISYQGSGQFTDANVATLLGNTTFGAGTYFSVSTPGNYSLTSTISGPQGLKVYGSTLTITGSNTFKGKVIVSGAISVASIGTGGCVFSNLGAPDSGADGAITLGAAWTTAGTVKYTGAGETTDRNIALAVNASDGATLNQSGNGDLKFTGTVGLGSEPLTLAGSTAGTGELAGTVSGAGTITKSGSGTWILSGENTYTGKTTVNANGGTLSVDGRLATGKITVNAGGTLDGSGTIAMLADDAATQKIVCTGTFDAADLTLDVTIADGSTLESFVLADCTGGTLLGADTLTVLAPSGWGKSVEGPRVLLKKVSGSVLLLR